MTARRQDVETAERSDGWSCPEALYGIHGEPNRAGRCPYCGKKIAAAQPRNWAAIRARNIAEQDPLRIEPDPDEDYWGH